MNNIIRTSVALLLAMILSACGGGGGDTAGGNNNPNNPNGQSGKLVIDNGRGTMNNQDTENVN